MVTQERLHSLSWGTVGFQSTRIEIIPFVRQLSRIGTGLAIDRTQREAEQPFVIGDLAGGLIEETNDIRGLELANRSTFSQGCVTRIPNLIGLPELVQNQSAITSDESIAGANAAGWKIHTCVTAVGSSSGAITYHGVGHKLYDVNTTTGAWALKDTFTDVITDLVEIEVGGARVLAVATRGATDDIRYVADPTAATPFTSSGVLLVALSAGDYITGMDFYETLGPVGATCIVGQVGGVNAMWWKAGDEAAPWTLEPLADSATRNLPNPDGTSVTKEYAPTKIIENTSLGTTTWSAPSNALASDDSDATTGTFSSSSSTILAGLGYGISLVAGSLLRGLRVLFEAAETGTDSSVGMSAGLLRSIDPANLAGDTFDFFATGDDASYWQGSAVNVAGATDAEYAFGTASTMPIPLTIAELESPGFTAGIRASGTVTNGVMNVDYGPRPELTFIPPGFSPSLPTGGFRINRDPTQPHRMTLLTPRSDEEGAVTKEREVWFADFGWDASGNRPVVTLSQPNEGAPHVEVAEPWLGGTLMATALKPGAGTDLKHYTAGGQLLDFDFPKKYGAYTPKIVWLLPVGSAVAIGVCLYNSGGTVVDYQTWYMLQVGQVFRYFADTPLTSLTKAPTAANMAIAVEPLRFATIAQDPQTSHIFTVFPDGTETAVRREKMHTNLYADPRMDNPTWTKQMAFASGTENTALAVRMPRINFGPEDALTALNEILLISQQVDNDSDYGTVEIEADSAGDTALATPEAQNTWTSATLTPYKLPTAGIAYDSLILQWKLTHEAGTDDTPNGAGVQLTTTQRLARRVMYRVRTNRKLLGEHNSLLSFLDAMDTLSVAKVTQVLRIEFDGVEAGYEGQVVATFESPQDLSGRPMGPLDVLSDDDFYLIFIKSAGKVAA